MTVVHILIYWNEEKYLIINTQPYPLNKQSTITMIYLQEATCVLVAAEQHKVTNNSN